MKTQAAWAEKYGFSAAYVSDMLNKRRDFSAKVLDILGLEIDYVNKRTTKR